MDPAESAANEGMAPTAVEVLTALLEEVRTSTAPVDRIHIQQGSFREFAVRVYPTEGEEFDAYILRV